jgi:hypothetical protein
MYGTKHSDFHVSESSLCGTVRTTPWAVSAHRKATSSTGQVANGIRTHGNSVQVVEYITSLRPRGHRNRPTKVIRKINFC